MRLSTFILKGIAGLDHSPEATFLVRQKVTLYTGLRCDLSVKTKPVFIPGSDSPKKSPLRLPEQEIA